MKEFRTCCPRIWHCVILKRRYEHFLRSGHLKISRYKNILASLFFPLIAGHKTLMGKISSLYQQERNTLTRGEESRLREICKNQPCIIEFLSFSSIFHGYPSPIPFAQSPLFCHVLS